MLVLPRRKAYGEHVNDHQVGTARKYASLGHVLVAETEHEIGARLAELHDFRPVPRQVNAAGLAQRIASFLDQDLQRRGCSPRTGR